MHNVYLRLSISFFNRSRDGLRYYRQRFRDFRQNRNRTARRRCRLGCHLDRLGQIEIVKDTLAGCRDVFIRASSGTRNIAYQWLKVTAALTTQHLLLHSQVPVKLLIVAGNGNRLRLLVLRSEASASRRSVVRTGNRFVI